MPEALGALRHMDRDVTLFISESSLDLLRSLADGALDHRARRGNGEAARAGSCVAVTPCR